MKNENIEEEFSQSKMTDNNSPTTMDDLKNQIVLAEKRNDTNEIIRLEKEIYTKENKIYLESNIDKQTKLREDILILEKEGKDPSQSEELLRQLEIEKKDLENKIIVLTVENKTNALKEKLIQQVDETSEIAKSIVDPNFLEKQEAFENEQIKVVVEAEAIMSLNIKDYTLADLENNLQASRMAIKNGEQKNVYGKYNEEQVLESEKNLRILEKIKKVRIEYDKELKDNEDKYQNYTRNLQNLQNSINAVEGWDNDKRAKIIEAKEKMETEFQEFVKNELEPLKSGKNFELNDKIDEGKNVPENNEKIDEGKNVPENNEKIDEGKNVPENNDKIPENVLEQNSEKKFKKIAGQGAEIIYKSIASRIGVKFLTDLGLTTWAKLGDALHQGEAKLFKFAKSNDIYRLLSDKKNTKEVMKILSESAEKKGKIAQRVESVRVKIENNDRLTAEEKKKYLEQLTGLLNKASSETQVNNKNSRKDLEKLTRAYLENKSSVVGVAKDMTNTALTLSGALVLRAALYGVSAGAERVLKAEKKYHREYVGKESKPSKMKYLVKDLCINSVKETMKDLTLAKEDESGRSLSKSERGLNVLRSVGNVYLVAGIGTDAWKQWLGGSSGAHDFIEATTNPNSSVSEVMWNNFINNLNRSTFGIFKSKIDTPEPTNSSNSNTANFRNNKSENNFPKSEDIISNKNLGVGRHDSVWRSTEEIFKKNPNQYGYNGDLKDTKAITHWASIQTANTLKNSGNFSNKVFEGNKIILDKDKNNHFYINVQQNTGLKPGHLENFEHNERLIPRHKSSLLEGKDNAKNGSLLNTEDSSQNIREDFQENIKTEDSKDWRTAAETKFKEDNKFVYSDTNKWSEIVEQNKSETNLSTGESRLVNKNIPFMDVIDDSRARSQVLQEVKKENNLSQVNNVLNHQNEKNIFPDNSTTGSKVNREINLNISPLHHIDSIRDLRGMTNGEKIISGNIEITKSNSVYHFIHNKEVIDFKLNSDKNISENNNTFALYENNKILGYNNNPADIPKIIKAELTIFENLSGKSELANNLLKDINHEVEEVDFYNVKLDKSLIDRLAKINIRLMEK